jgi:hypothetical protein
MLIQLSGGGDIHEEDGVLAAWRRLQRQRVRKLSGGGGASLDEGNDKVEETTMATMDAGKETRDFLPDLRGRGLSPRGFRSKPGPRSGPGSPLGITF